MKKLALCFLGLALLCCPLAVLYAATAFAQQKHSPQLGSDYLDVGGVRLRLGMSKSELENKFSSENVTKTDDGGWFLKVGVSYSTLRFTDGKLTFADRSWRNGDADTFDALFGLVTSLNNEGYSACTVFADTRADPQLSARRVWIRCGKKAILVIEIKEGQKTHDEVTEQLGVWTDDTK